LELFDPAQFFEAFPIFFVALDIQERFTGSVNKNPSTLPDLTRQHFLSNSQSASVFPSGIRFAAGAQPHNNRQTINRDNFLIPVNLSFSLDNISICRAEYCSGGGHLSLSSQLCLFTDIF